MRVLRNGCRTRTGSPVARGTAIASFPSREVDMKFRAGLALLLIVVSVCVMGWTTLGQRQSSSTIQWEYATRHKGDNELAGFKELGSQGWELVNVTDDGWGYFKRQKK